MADALLSNGHPAGNYYDKYATTNPIARWMMRGFFDAVTGFARQTGEREAHEVGCGEGHLTRKLHDLGITVRGSDVCADIVTVAQTQHGSVPITFKTAGIEDLSVADDAAPLVVCCEVLEHLEDPDAALDRLQGLAMRYLIVSVPREPLWRLLNICRGRYWGALGNTPGHLQHWSTAGLLRLLERHVDVLEVATPVPWTVALCKPRR